MLFNSVYDDTADILVDESVKPLYDLIHCGILSNMLFDTSYVSL